MKAFNTKQLSVSTIARSLSDFAFSASDLVRMESATFYTKADILITYDGVNPPVASPEFGIYLASGVIFSLQDRENLDNLQMIRAGSTDSLVTVTLEYKTEPND